MKYENVMQIYSVSQKDYMSFSRDFLMQIVCQTENSQSPIIHDCGILILNTVCYFLFLWNGEQKKKTTKQQLSACNFILTFQLLIKVRTVIWMFLFYKRNINHCELYALWGISRRRFYRDIVLGLTTSLLALFYLLQIFRCDEHLYYRYKSRVWVFFIIKLTCEIYII